MDVLKKYCTVDNERTSSGLSDQDFGRRGQTGWLGHVSLGRDGQCTTYCNTWPNINQLAEQEDEFDGDKHKMWHAAALAETGSESARRVWKSAERPLKVYVVEMLPHVGEAGQPLSDDFVLWPGCKWLGEPDKKARLQIVQMRVPEWVSELEMVTWLRRNEWKWRRNWKRIRSNVTHPRNAAVLYEGWQRFYKLIPILFTYPTIQAGSKQLTINERMMVEMDLMCGHLFIINCIK